MRDPRALQILLWKLHFFHERFVAGVAFQIAEPRETEYFGETAITLGVGTIQPLFGRKVPLPSNIESVRFFKKIRR
jgi:hypothetical protein